MAYVYRHIRIDKNEPFYIGIGKTTYRHSARQGRNPIWKKIVAKTDFEVEILFDNIEWNEACKKEIEFIALYGRIDLGTGTLANLTNGGDGNLGLVHSEEALKKISESSKKRNGYWKGKRLSEETIKKISLSRIGNTWNKGRKLNLTIEQRADIGKRMKDKGPKYQLGHSVSEEIRKKIGDANRGKKRTPEIIQKMVNAAKKKAVLKKHKTTDDILAEYISVADAAKETGVDPSTLAKACRGKLKSYKGYKWEYKKTAQ